MKRQTLDKFFVVAGLALAFTLLALALVLRSNASFAKNYVRDQLSAQAITFTPKVGLNDAEQKAICLTNNAGKPLLSGPQAECYANEYIAGHLKAVNAGKTYSQSSSEARRLRTEAADAVTQGASNAQQLGDTATKAEAQVETLFRGETLRGLLLTSFGFSEFGRKASQAADVAFLAAFVLLLAGIAGGVHASRAKGELVD